MLHRVVIAVLARNKSWAHGAEGPRIQVRPVLAEHTEDRYVTLMACEESRRCSVRRRGIQVGAELTEHPQKLHVALHAR